jgi:hypothetical protein
MQPLFNKIIFCIFCIFFIDEHSVILISIARRVSWSRIERGFTLRQAGTRHLATPHPLTMPQLYSAIINLNDCSTMEYYLHPGDAKISVYAETRIYSAVSLFCCVYPGLNILWRCCVEGTRTWEVLLLVTGEGGGQLFFLCFCIHHAAALSLYLIHRANACLHNMYFLD